MEVNHILVCYSGQKHNLNSNAKNLLLVKKLSFLARTISHNLSFPGDLYVINRIKPPTGCLKLKPRLFKVLCF